jgi:hypothetical protein
MDGELISERNYAQETPAKRWHRGPEAKTIAFPRLNAHRRFNDPNAHLACEIWPFSQNAILKYGVKAYSATHGERSSCVVRDNAKTRSKYDQQRTHAPLLRPSRA